MESERSGWTGRRNRGWFIGIGGVVLAAAIWAFLGTRADGTAQEQQAPLPPLVTVSPAELQEVSGTVTITGTISARNELPIGVDTETGRISQVNVDIGARVKAGQVLARLDTALIRPQVERLEATLAQARAEAQLAAADWKRAQGVEAAGALSAADIEQRRSTLDQKEALVRVAAAQLAEMRARLNRTEIRAPAAGVVLTRNAEVGQIVSPGGDPLFRIAEDGAVELRGKVAEQDLPLLDVGQPATVRLAGVDQTFQGEVRLLGAIIDTATRLGEVRVALESHPALRPGAFARGEVVVSDARRPVLPQTAVLSDAQGTYVFVVGPDSKVQRRGVTVGDTTARGIVISGGLSGDERVVTTAGAFLREGEEIRAAPAATQRAADPGAVT